MRCFRSTAVKPVPYCYEDKIEFVNFVCKEEIRNRFDKLRGFKIEINISKKI